MIKLVNWRHEALLLAIAGMETCLVVAWSRVLLRGPGLAIAGLSWWSVWVLFIMGLITARTLGRLELQRGSWYIAAIALVTAFLLLYVNLGATPVGRGRTEPREPDLA